MKKNIFSLLLLAGFSCNSTLAKLGDIWFYNKTNEPVIVEMYKIGEGHYVSPVIQPSKNIKKNVTYAFELRQLDVYRIDKNNKKTGSPVLKYQFYSAGSHDWTRKTNTSFKNAPAPTGINIFIKKDNDVFSITTKQLYEVVSIQYSGTDYR